MIRGFSASIQTCLRLSCGILSSFQRIKKNRTCKYGSWKSVENVRIKIGGRRRPRRGVYLSEQYRHQLGHHDFSWLQPTAHNVRKRTLKPVKKIEIVAQKSRASSRLKLKKPVPRKQNSSASLRREPYQHHRRQPSPNTHYGGSLGVILE